ncbi:MAG: hypothetical protein MN733_36110, partial [Nitrososphaera sp.]|nr:hypothetical protein [Nitrososphaera sp.]
FCLSFMRHSPSGATYTLEDASFLCLPKICPVVRSLINVVTSSKPKMLTGLNQNGMWSGLDAA